MMGLLVVLMACGPTNASPSVSRAAEVEAEPAPARSGVSDELAELPLHELIAFDTRGAVEGVERVRAELHGLSPEARAEVAESMDFLARNCPYTRSSLQLAFTLDRVFDDMPLGEIDAFVQSDWLLLRRGTAAHVHAFEQMGGGLPLPETGDYLFHHDADWLLSRDELAGHPDPLGPTLAMLEQVDPLVQGMPASTFELVQFHTDRVERHIGHPAALSDHTMGWHDGLRRVEPFVTAPEVVDTVQRLLEAVALHGRKGC